MLASGIPAATLTFTNGGSGVAAGATYSYYVRARNSSGTKNSNSLSVTTSSTCGLTLVPTAVIADAQVRNSSPTSNEGTTTTLRTREDPSGTTYRSYLKFDVTGLSSTADVARLRVYATAGNSAGLQIYATGGGWTETGINWNTAPALGALLGSTGAIAQNTWVEIPLQTASFVGNQAYSLVLVGRSTSSGYVASRESGNRPQLILATGGLPVPPPDPVPPAPFSKSAPANGASNQSSNLTLNWTASAGAASYQYCLDTIDNSACDTAWTSTAAAASILVNGLNAGTSYWWQVRAVNDVGTVEANTGGWWAFTTATTTPSPTPATTTIVADAQVRNSSPSSNEGTLTTLRTREDPSGTTYRSYLKFDVTGSSGTPVSAKLRLYATAGNSLGIQVYAGANGWTETGINWNNAPMLGTLLASTGAITQNTWVEIGLPSSLFTTSQAYTLILVGKPTQSAYFASRESVNKPQLVFDGGSSGGGGGGGPVPGTPLAWPGGTGVQTADGSNVFGGNLSGLAYEGTSTPAPGVIWAVRNNPGSLFRLVWNGTIWTPDTNGSWGSGKTLRYPGGSGSPDAEGVTFALSSSGGVYVASERNNDVSGTSRNSILRFDATSSGSTLTATHEWNLTADLPAVGANLGIEAIAWIPDSFLVSRGFADQSRGPGTAYDPAAYPNHGTGLFFVGVEANGVVYAYALDHARGGFTRLATIVTGLAGVMDLHFDRELNDLWAACDDTCNGRSAVLRIGVGTGTFAVAQFFDRPGSMPNLNNEGITFAPLAECVANVRSAFWADDGETGGHAVRQGTVTCTSP